MRDAHSWLDFLVAILGHKKEAIVPRFQGSFFPGSPHVQNAIMCKYVEQASSVAQVTDVKANI